MTATDAGSVPGRMELPPHVKHASELHFFSGMGSPWKLAREILGPDATDESVHRAGVAVRDFAEAFGWKCMDLIYRKFGHEPPVRLSPPAE